MRTRNIVAASVTVLVLVPAAAACGGSASANGSSAGATVTSRSGTTTASGNVAGHSFSAQIASLGSLKRIRVRLEDVRGHLAATTFPSSVQTQKQELMGFLDQWDADLGPAESSARQGDTAQALRQAQSTTYDDLKSLIDTIRSTSGG
jgi:hypothetical protein